MVANDTSDFHSGRPFGFNKKLLMTAVGILFLGTATGGVMTLHSRANAEKSPNAFPPVAVETQAVKIVDSYTIEERFIGLLEPARQTRLAFERSGLVTKILVEEGTKVAYGEVLAKLDTRKLQSERLGLVSRYEELKSRYELAQVTLSRQKTLKAKGWQSDQKYDEAHFAAEQLSSAMKHVEASIDSIDVDISKSVLRAPYAGTIAGRLIDEGSVVSAGIPIADIMETSSPHARIGVSVETASNMKHGNVYRLETGGRELNGSLISKRPDLELGSRTVTLLFEVADATGIKFGEMVELVATRGIAERGAWVPVGALTEDTKGLWSVFSPENNGTQIYVTRQSVEVLHVDNQRVFVRGDLPENGSIIIGGTNRVVAGQIVTPRPVQAGL